MNADGTNGSVIVSNIDSDNLNRLSWSSDSNWIAFSKGGQIWRVRRDGTQLTQIITNGGWEPSIGASPSVCTPQANESDILLVVDRSGSMADNNKLNDAKAAVTTFANLTNAPPDQLGLVSFSTSATLDQPLTTNKAAVISATQALAAGGSTRIDLALLQARLELTSTRHIISHAKIIILLTDGLQSQTGNDPVLAEAAAAKAEGATIFTIGLGPDVDASLLQQVATSPAHYFFAPSGAQLQAIYEQISAAINCLDIGGRTYVDQDDNGVYTPGTDAPLPNIRIRLAGPVTRTTTSLASGAYLFANNFPGVYTLTLDLSSVPPAYQPISPTLRVISLAARDELDNHFGFRFQTEDGVIVFTRPLPAGGAVNSDVWIMDADGTNQTQLTSYDQEDRMPALSPDGSKVAYVSYRGGRHTLWTMNSDGTNAIQLPVGGNTNRIAWSWDSSRLAITNDSEDWWEIWTIDANGSNLKRLTTYGPPIGNPSWSPNGWKIVYTVNPGWMVSDIYTMNSDGTGQSLLVSASGTGYSNHMPAWSPDGTKIATVRWPAGGAGPFDLWLMNADGSGGSVLAQNIDDPHLNRISWTPDGAWIVFAKNGQVWRVKPDGSLPTQLTAAGGWEPLARPRFTVAAPIRRIYLPAIARNYCSGPIVDDFGNPGSGWPISETAYWSYSYLSGEYRMYAKAAAFAGVSRGDRLAGQYTVEIDARKASGVEGSLGILLGIADDWSEFYTFEVFPDFQVGAIFHNLNGRWTLVNYASSGAILPGQFTNRLRVETSTAAGHYAHFYINGAYIASLAIPYAPSATRRVGLTASADDAGFDARFDNYKVVPEGCPASFVTSQLSMPQVRSFHEASRDVQWDSRK
jgi:Tol biopolymer transport system component